MEGLRLLISLPPQATPACAQCQTTSSQVYLLRTSVCVFSIVLQISPTFSQSKYSVPTSKDKAIMFPCRTWHLGPLFCTVTNFMSYYTVATSVFSLMAITVERSVFSWYSLFNFLPCRYLVVMKPLNGRIRQSSVLLGVIAIFLPAFLCCIPVLVFSTTKTLRF